VEELHQRLRRDGYLFVRGVIPDDAVARARLNILRRVAQAPGNPLKLVAGAKQEEQLLRAEIARPEQQTGWTVDAQTGR